MFHCYRNRIPFNTTLVKMDLGEMTGQSLCSNGPNMKAHLMLWVQWDLCIRRTLNMVSSVLSKEACGFTAKCLPSPIGPTMSSDLILISA